MLIHAPQVSDISVLFNTFKLTNGIMECCPTFTPNAEVLIGQENSKFLPRETDLTEQAINFLLKEG